MKLASACTISAMLAAFPAVADDFSAAIQGFYETELAGWASNQMLIDAVNAQNAQTSGYSLDQIDALDKAWRAEVGQASTPTISPVLDNSVSAFLRDQVNGFGGRVTEIFVMDAQGLNVAASDVTSDYWQGDEEKHSQTYVVGPGAVHVADVELDESTQRYQGQVSFTLVDPATGQAVGAVTVGVDAESLM